MKFDSLETTSTIVALDPCLNLTSPYYLHLRENPGLVLVSPSLNETNYHTWSRNMKKALLFQNKLKFVDLSLSSRSDSSFEACERCNVMVLSWISRILSP